MLQEVSMVEQRYLAVREVLDTGAAANDVATRYGGDRRTLHPWLLRYANDGLGALVDRSSKPDRCPHQISPERLPRRCERTSSPRAASTPSPDRLGCVGGRVAHRAEAPRDRRRPADPTLRARSPFVAGSHRRRDRTRT